MGENNLLFPHGVLTGTEVMIDCLDDNLRRLKRQMEKIDNHCLYWQPDAEANSIAVILWHMGRILDVFFHLLALGLSTDQQVWFRCGWAEKTGYDPRGIGRDGWGSLNDYTLQEVAAMPRYTDSDLMGFIEMFMRICGISWLLPRWKNWLNLEQGLRDVIPVIRSS